MKFSASRKPETGDSLIKVFIAFGGPNAGKALAETRFPCTVSYGRDNKEVSVKQHGFTYDYTLVSADDEYCEIWTLESEVDAAIHKLASNRRDMNLREAKEAWDKANARLSELLATTVDDYIGVGL
jgi:hypothetical protein